MRWEDALQLAIDQSRVTGNHYYVRGFQRYMIGATYGKWVYGVYRNDYPPIQRSEFPINPRRHVNRFDYVNSPEFWESTNFFS